MQITRQVVFDEIKKKGLDAVKKRVLGMGLYSGTKYDKIIKDYEDEVREEKSLRISRKALNWAIVATIIALAAMILSIIAYIWPPKS